jgi:beta-aspartyl-peptidase (threonine type)
MTGAVAGVVTVKNPVRAARAVMEKTDHVLIVGEGAEKFAAEKAGLPQIDNATLVTERAVKMLQKNQVFAKTVHNHYSAWASSKEVTSKTDLKRICSQRNVDDDDASCDSVGAVALDGQGRTAVAISTAGITGKLPGRVGDAPLPGCGFYADDNVAAVCCTGHGECVMRAALAHRVMSCIASGKEPQEAAQEGLDFMRLRLDGFGGVIAVAATGKVGVCFSTFRMPWAYRTTDELHYGIDKGDHFFQKPGDPLDGPKIRWEANRDEE